MHRKNEQEEGPTAPFLSKKVMKISKEELTKVVEQHLEGSDLFVVETTVSPSWDIEISLDSDSRVSIDQCVALTRAVEEAFDREALDFSLTVGSAGIGQPLRLARQFDKIVGKEVEILRADGKKLLATLQHHDAAGITVAYTVKEAVEGKKRKVEVEKTETIPFSELKTVCEALIV